MIKVVKFGGSSLASAEQFAKVGKIIQADKERRYVVPSAPGNAMPRTPRSQICYMPVMRWWRRRRISACR